MVQTSRLITPLPASICAHILRASPETGNNVSRSKPPPHSSTRCHPWNVSLPPQPRFLLSFSAVSRATFLSHLRKEKKVSCPSHPPATVLFFCFVCCSASGESGLYGLSPLPPLLFSLKPASVRRSPLLLTFLRAPSRSLRPSGVTSQPSSHLACHSIGPLPSPGSASSLGCQGDICPASIPFTQFLTDLGVTLECWCVPRILFSAPSTLTALLISCGLVTFNPSVRWRILSLGLSLDCSPEGQTRASHCPRRAFP